MNFAKKYLEEKEKQKQSLIKMAKKQIEKDKKLRDRFEKNKHKEVEELELSVEPVGES